MGYLSILPVAMVCPMAVAAHTWATWLPVLPQQALQLESRATSPWMKYPMPPYDAILPVSVVFLSSLFSMPRYPMQLPAADFWVLDHL